MLPTIRQRTQINDSYVAIASYTYYSGVYFSFPFLLLAGAGAGRPKQMKGEGVEPGDVVYTAALAECRWAGQARHVEYLLQQMEVEGMTIVPGLGTHALSLGVVRGSSCGKQFHYVLRVRKYEDHLDVTFNKIYAVLKFRAQQQWNCRSTRDSDAQLLQFGDKHVVVVS